MKKLLILFLLSLGFVGNSYADIRHCSLEEAQSRGLERCYLKHEHDEYYVEFKCNEGYIKKGNRCLKEGETPQEEFKKIILDENGQKKGESVNKDGKLFKLTLFYKNGQKEIETVNIFDNGYWNEYFSWHENGQKESEYSYNKENKKDGKWTYWNEDGEITSEVIYKDGVCLSGDCPN